MTKRYRARRSTALRLFFSPNVCSINYAFQRPSLALTELGRNGLFSCAPVYSRRAIEIAATHSKFDLRRMETESANATVNILCNSLITPTVRNLLQTEHEARDECNAQADAEEPAQELQGGILEAGREQDE
jgi:hypothetical protein